VRYRQLGSSGLRVSVVGLGGNNFGRRVDAAATKNIVHAALDAGMNLFDTAESYGDGESERSLGAALKERRSQAIIATKFGSPHRRPPDVAPASRRALRLSIEGSLRRLGTDYIDLYQLHFPDPHTPIEETLAALDEVVRAGLVRYIGCSNFSAWQVVEAEWIARTSHGARFVSAQNHYNLLERDVETELVPVCLKYGLGLLPYFPLANGLLTGKYRRGQPPPEGSRLAGRPQALVDGALERVEKLEDYARQRGISLLAVAIGGLAAMPAVGSVIAGATSPSQVAQNAAAGEWEPGEADLAALRQILDPSAAAP
jgi:aryl-alcohol dehydrogenase-like predicted oxidoreductase